MTVSITREQVKNSPDIDTDKPVSRQHEADYLGYYGYPVYWDSIGIWGSGGVPGMMLPDAALAPAGVGVVGVPACPARRRSVDRENGRSSHRT